jgi:hypothetical protein
MVEPVILSNEILAAAEQVSAYYRERWRSPADFIHVGDADLLSPVDGLSRTVRFHLADGFSTKAATVCGLRAPGHEVTVVGDGNTVVLNRGMITSRDLFMPILLHEVCHAIDPVFEEEWRGLNQPGRPRARPTHEEACRFRHEQRAFPAMWKGYLQAELASGEYRSPAASISLYRSVSTEFDWFYRATPDLADQTREHFWLIVDELNRRRGA